VTSAQIKIMEEKHRPKFIVCILVFKDGKVLLGKRRGDKKSDGMYGTPGGHMESLESFSDCIRREIAEEVGIEVEHILPVTISNVRDFAPTHYVVISMKADWKSGELQTLEPDRCEGWGWFGLDALPSPLTPATSDVIEALKTGQIAFDRDMK
jgi:8-oxo-dGTP diphosphatase